MLFFRKGRKHRKRNRDNAYKKEKKSKTFGLTRNEMDSLVLNLALKPKIPVVSVR